VIEGGGLDKGAADEVSDKEYIVVLEFKSQKR